MVDIRPFQALRPTPELALAVASPPYDVLDSAEARAMAAGNPHSFLHVTKSEIDLPLGTGLYDEIVYETARLNLSKMIAEGVLVQDADATFYVYQQRMGNHVQVGIVAGTSVAEYNTDIIKKHEKTRQAKEDDRTRHILATGANTGPVFLTYRQQAGIDALVTSIQANTPDVDIVCADGIGHTLWVVKDLTVTDQIQRAFENVGVMYIADGHHRSASAARVAEIMASQNPNHTGDESYNYFMSVIFPDNQLKILDYNRLVTDLNGLSEADFLEKIGVSFEVTPIAQRKPSRANEFTMFLGGKWYALLAKPGTFDEADPVAGLDVSILQDNLLSPILGIGDPRLDDRIDFVGGIRGISELERRVNEGAAAAFAVYPTSMAQLFAIADAGEIMPPKSTWFEPKLRSGLVIRTIG